MRLRTRAVSLCAALLVLAMPPAAAQAQEPTQHGVTWPSAAGTYMQSDIVSSGVCPPVGETATFTFHYENPGSIHGAEGQFEEHGSYTLIGTEEDALVTQFDSSFSGTSPNGSITGTRHMEEWRWRATGASCEGTSDADRLVSIGLQHVETEHTLTSASTGARTTERGWAYVGVTAWAAQDIGSYLSVFHSDEDNDNWDIDEDNCPDVENFDQADSDGDGTGDVCDADFDSDGDGVGDLVDNCDHVANPTQANADGDRFGDACDPDGDADGDAVLDVVDNCPGVANPTQRDSDEDGAGDACDGAFASTDGFAGGGGKLAGGVHVSVALHSAGGRLHGSGRLVDGSTIVKLTDLTGLRSDGDRAVGVGHASIDGAQGDYRLEIVESTNTFELEVGDRRWAGALTNGNLVVK